MKYMVSQNFETIGEPCTEEFDSLESAEKAATIFRRELTRLLAGWEITEEHGKTGFLHERDAWTRARELSDGYYLGTTAARYLAEQAVVIEVKEEAK